MSRPSIVLSGALVKIYINNRVYNEAQSVSYTLDYGETEVYGIDTPFPQEIHSTRAMVAGSISGIRIRNSGGIQSFNARPRITDIVKAEYISIRIQDRSTGEDLLFVPNAKISKQSLQAQAKGVVRLSFDFKGLVGFEPSDRG
jgi:hypothetical protein